MATTSRCPGCNTPTTLRLCAECKEDVATARQRRAPRVSYADDAPASDRTRVTTAPAKAPFEGPYGTERDMYFYR